MTIKHIDNFLHLDRIVNEQLKEDRENSSIHPHLRQMDNLVQEISEDIRLSKKQNFVRTLYPKSKCGVILRKRQTHTDLAEYLHASCFAPVKSTFLKAINKGFFKTWPGLSQKLVKKHLHPSTYTAKGHLAQTRQHLQSTKIPPPTQTSTYLDNIKKNIKAIRKSDTSDGKQ